MSSLTSSFILPICFINYELLKLIYEIMYYVACVRANHVCFPECVSIKEKVVRATIEYQNYILTGLLYLWSEDTLIALDA